MDVIIVRLISPPVACMNGITILDENADYNIYINDRLTCEQQRLALIHELMHIKREHFYSSVPTSEIEKEMSI